MKTLILILLLSTPVSAQIGIGHSVPLWGKTIKTAEISYQYDRFSVHYFHNYREMFVNNDGELRYARDTSTLAIGARLFESKHFNFGGIVSKNKFPLSISTRVNFLIEFNLPLNRFILSYTHISNGFGIFHESNHGYDSLKLSISIL